MFTTFIGDIYGELVEEGEAKVDLEEADILSLKNVTIRRSDGSLELRLKNYFIFTEDVKGFSATDINEV